MVCFFSIQGGRFRGLTMGFPPLQQRSSARRSFGRSKRLSLARSLDDLEVAYIQHTIYMRGPFPTQVYQQVMHITAIFKVRLATVLLSCLSLRCCFCL